MISANDARVITEASQRTANCWIEIRIIQREIFNAATNGKSSCNITWEISAVARKVLLYYGYYVYDCVHCECVVTMVIWDRYLCDILSGKRKIRRLKEEGDDE